MLALCKCVLRAWGELKRWFQLLAPGDICFAGMGEVAKWPSGVGAGQNVI